MPYSRDANGTWRRIAKVVPLSDASGGPDIGSTGGYGDHDVVRDQDPANLRRPPMAPRAQLVTTDNLDEFSSTDDDLFPTVIKTGPATRWQKVAKATNGVLALYQFADRGRTQWLVKSADGRRHQYTAWEQVSGIGADWITLAGGKYRPAGLTKSDSTHPLRIDVQGRIATRLMADSTGGLYGMPDGNFYRLVFRGNDGSIRIRRDEIPLADEMRQVLTDNSDGTLDPKRGHLTDAKLRTLD